MNQVAKVRADILALEDSMKDMEGYDEGGNDICRISHYNVPGLYAR